MRSLTSEPDRVLKSEQSVPKMAWYLNPYLHIGLNVILTAVANILFKAGSDNTPGGSLLGVSSFGSPAVWMGIGCMICALFVWLHALRFVPLIIAFSLAAATQIVIPLGSWLFLGEQISLVRWAGIVIVTLGIMIIARPLARLEERL
ncbi:MAG TPA: EamA family transporter [Chthoniobacterales bacterium]|jgi:drug/metabolite transporter (DMT)-like permease|nr:EamA family transporter [Chthoniobacterales bacterium]